MARHHLPPHRLRACVPRACETACLSCMCLLPVHDCSLSVCLSVVRLGSAFSFANGGRASSPCAPRQRSGTREPAAARSMASGDDPLVLADEKAAEARELLAKELFDPAIELLATALELRCMPALSRPARTFTL